MRTPTFDHDTKRVLNQLDFSSNKPSVVYSGEGNSKRAEAYANKNGVKTISHTEGGRYLESPNRFKEHGVEKAKALWAAGSQKFVSTIKGDVRTFVAGAKHNGIFRRRETAAMVNNNDIGKVNGIDRTKLKTLYDKTYQKSRDQGMANIDARSVASTQTYRATAVAELRATRREAYQSADKKQIVDYQKRKDAYLNQRIDDKKMMAAKQGVAYKGPEKKTPAQRTLDRRIDSRNMHARASLEKNIRDGHVSKQDAPKEKARIESSLKEFAKSDRSNFQARETNRSFNNAAGSTRSYSAQKSSEPTRAM